MSLLFERSECIKNLAYKALLDANIEKLPVNILNVAKNFGIRVIDNREVSELSSGECGAAIYDGKTWNIVYDSSFNIGRIRFTIAHEIGHIVLGHGINFYDGEQMLIKNISTKEFEDEADFFAAILLAPPCILQELGAYSASSIALLCRLSTSCAKIQSKTMVNLLLAKKRENNCEEKRLVKNFEAYIKNNKLKSFERENIHKFKGNMQGLYNEINTQVRKRKDLGIDVF